jgi:hypothetical protein
VQFENLIVGRIAVHEVFQRSDNREMRQPVYGETLEQLSPDARAAFRQRITDALAARTQSLAMTIQQSGPGSFVAEAHAIVGSTDEAFLAFSRRIADKLAATQLARSIPGGMVVVFDGTVGARSHRLVGVIKAETQAGFRRDTSVLEFIKNIFLTPATRLYKIGIMIQHDSLATDFENGWQAHVFDRNISVNSRETAAMYFYESFLGCSLPADGAYETVKFFDLTKEFVKSSQDIPPSKKRDVMDSLFVFLRTEDAATFTASQFSERYIPAAVRDPYETFLQSRKFTSNAVVRDTSQMGNRLRRRRLSFGGDIELSASPQTLADKNKVEIKDITETQVDGEMQPVRWTQITIKEPPSGER